MFIDKQLIRHAVLKTNAKTSQLLRIKNRLSELVIDFPKQTIAQCQVHPGEVYNVICVIYVVLQSALGNEVINQLMNSDEFVSIKL